MSNLKCPFCHKKITQIFCGDMIFWMCNNPKCKESFGLGGNLEIWKKIAKMQNKLDLVLQGLKTLSQIADTINMSDAIDDLINEINLKD